MSCLKTSSSLREHWILSENALNLILCVTPTSLILLDTGTSRENKDRDLSIIIIIIII